MPIVYTTKTTSTHAFYAWHVSQLIVLIFFSLRLKYFNRRIKMQGTNKSKHFPISILVLMKVILLEYLYTEFESEIRSQIIFVRMLYFVWRIVFVLYIWTSLLLKRIQIVNHAKYPFIIYFQNIYRKFFSLIRCLWFVDMIWRQAAGTLHI